MTAKEVRLTVSISPDVLRRLENAGAVLAMLPQDIVRFVLTQLDTGIVRPGSWERGFAEELLGEDAVEHAFECELRLSGLGT